MPSPLVRSILGLLLLTSPATAADPDILIADFEGSDYGQWTVTGEAFGPGPARGTLPGQMSVTGYLGNGLVNSFFNGDGSTGTLTSPPFVVQRDFLNFLLGGGMHPGEACINLLVDGEVVRTATGPNDRPGGNEQLDWSCWDVKDLKGRQAVIQIVDLRQGGWGHINIDQLVQSNQKQAVGPASRSMLIGQRFLHLPVKNGAQKVKMKVAVGTRTVDEFDIELAPAAPDFWVFLDMRDFRDQSATITVDRLAADSQGLANVRCADAIPAADQLYREKYRPQFHFSPRVGWNNDPNGLVYYKGEWHLYFQHNPYGWGWGNMHWGHAVSKNLVQWTELPMAIYPHAYGDWVFSGGAVVDQDNTAGFKSGQEDVIVASYTSTGRGEAIAYSNDRGRSFTDFAGNPVIKHQGRDPKIIWYAPGKHWVMAVYDEQQEGGIDKRQIAFYTSPDLKAWTWQSAIDGYFECPEIFELPVDGKPDDRRWVIYAADGAYAVGSFDGRTFTPQHEGKRQFNWGNCFYASQTYSNVPPADGRRIQIAWGQIGSPEMPFNQQMNFPVELTLHTTSEGERLYAQPVREIALLHGTSAELTDVALSPDSNPLADLGSELLHLQAELEVAASATVTFQVRGEAITYDATQQQLSCGDKSAPLRAVDGRIHLEILVDRMSIEIFGNHGQIYLPMGKVLDVDNRSLGVSAAGGGATIRHLRVYQLNSAWPR